LSSPIGTLTVGGAMMVVAAGGAAFIRHIKLT